MMIERLGEFTFLGLVVDDISGDGGGRGTLYSSLSKLLVQSVGMIGQRGYRNSKQF